MGKVLITGSSGQLGSELKNLLPNAIFTNHKELDITKEQEVESFIKINDVDIVVNCAAYTAVDKAEDNIELSNSVNVNGPKNLAKSGCKIIHISTDYVFDGKNHKPYIPDDKTNPLSVYGKTKLEGENAILENCNEAIIIRTSWLYSFYGNNFVKTIKRLGMEKENISVVYDQIGTPTYAKDLAIAIVKIIPQINKNNKGIYHFSNEGVCSWYDFATEIIDCLGLKCKINPILSSSYPTKATRPFYSVLDKKKIKEAFNIEIPHWKESLKKCLKQF